MIEPYRYASGDAHGEPEPPEPTYGSSRPRRGNLAQRVRRAKTDPNWSSHSAALKRVLLQDDSKGQP